MGAARGGFRATDEERMGRSIIHLREQNKNIEERINEKAWPPGQTAVFQSISGFGKFQGKW
jgi:hypothetical protein